MRCSFSYFYLASMTTFFRFKNGTGVVATDTNVKYMGINKDYYSKDTLIMASHSSFILPKESPLAVSMNSWKI